jgi:hypothetical protein
MVAGSVSFDWDDYQPYQPSVPGLLNKLPRTAARQEFSHLMQAKPARHEMLGRLAEVNGLRLSGDDASIQELNDLFRGNVQPDPEQPGRLLPEWYSVVRDTALFLGDVLIERHPTLRWEFYTWGKTNVSYQRPVIMGFSQVPNEKYCIDIDRRVATYAHRVVAERGSVPQYDRETVRGVQIDVAAAVAQQPRRPVEPDAFVSWLRIAESQA